MTIDKTNIPRDIKGYGIFIVETNTYLIQGTPQNYVRFGWSAANLSAWQAFQTQWAPIYLLYQDKKGGYTTDRKNDLTNIIEATVLYDKQNKLIYKVKATAGLTSIDCSTFNLPLSLSKPVPSIHHPVVPLSTDKTILVTVAVYVRIIAEAGGFVHIKAYTEKAQKGHAHKAKGYDLLEYKWAVFYSGTANLPLHPTDSRLLDAHSTKANFTISTAENTTNLPVLAATAVETVKMVVFFFRWAKSKHPNLDGPWSGPFTTPLL